MQYVMFFSPRHFQGSLANYMYTKSPKNFEYSKVM